MAGQGIKLEHERSKEKRYSDVNEMSLRKVELVIKEYKPKEIKINEQEAEELKEINSKEVGILQKLFSDSEQECYDLEEELQKEMKEKS